MDSAGKRGVIYFNLGVKCCVRLLVSLHSLRKHYDGPVTILCADDEGKEICDRVATACGAGVVVIPIQYRKKNTAYTTKAGLWKFSKYETTLLLDSDTVVAGDISPLFDFAEKSGLVVTRFADWVSTGKLIRGRLEKWHGVRWDGLDDLLKASLEAPRAAINTGVVCWSNDLASDFLRDWESLTIAGWRCPFGDELAAQLLIRKHEHTLVSDSFNCSPIYGTNKDKARIWHAHGSKEWRPEAQPIWRPLIEEVWQQNAADVRSWMPNADCDKYCEIFR